MDDADSKDRVSGIIDVPGYEGRATRLPAGCHFRVIDVEGAQIADMFVLCADDTDEVFSPAMTRQVNFRLTARPGDVLYSNHHRPMLTFMHDSSPGFHDMAFAPCDPDFYVALGAEPSHPNCRDNFDLALAALDMHLAAPPDPFNLFQNTVPRARGDYVCGPSLSKAGDHVEFRTEMAVILVVTACSVDLPIEGVEPIAGKSTPLRIQIL